MYPRYLSTIQHPQSQHSAPTIAAGNPLLSRVLSASLCSSRVCWFFSAPRLSVLCNNLGSLRINQKVPRSTWAKLEDISLRWTLRTYSSFPADFQAKRNSIIHLNICSCYVCIFKKQIYKYMYMSYRKPFKRNSWQQSNSCQVTFLCSVFEEAFGL